MPPTDSLPPFMILTVLAAGLGLLALGVAAALIDQGRRLAALRAELAALAAHQAESVGPLVDRLEAAVGAMAAAQSGALAPLAADLAAVRAEVEWLGGERMIEEAVRLCREGRSNAQICDDLGLSAESVRAIALLRAH